MAYPIKYIENNLVWNKDGECYAYYELVPYNYSFLSPEQKIQVHDSFRQLIAQNRDGKIHALQISTESSIRSAQERSKNEVTGKLKAVAYDKIDQQTDALISMIGENQVNYRFFIGFKLLLNDQEFSMKSLTVEAKNALSDFVYDVNHKLMGDFVSMSNDEILRFQKMEKLLENKISRRFKIRRLDKDDFGYLIEHLYGQTGTAYEEYEYHLSKKKLDNETLIKYYDLIKPTRCLVEEKQRYLKIQQEDETVYVAYFTINSIVGELDFPSSEIFYYQQQQFTFPIDTSMNVEIVANRKALSTVRNKKKELKDLDNHAWQSDNETSSNVAEALESVNELETNLDQSKESMYKLSYVVRVSANDLDELKRRCNEVKDFYDDLSVKLVRPFGDMLGLHEEFLPASKRYMNDYIQYVTSDFLAGLGFGATQMLGENEGIYVGYSLDTGRNVYLKPALASQGVKGSVTNALASAFVGSLGGGKSFANNLIVYYAVLYGAQAVIVDPKAERGRWKETLPEISHEINIVTLTSDEKNKGLLDPYVIMKNPKDSESLAIDILTFLTGISSRDGERFPILRKAIRAVTNSEVRGLMKVIEELRVENTPLSTSIADHIESFTDYDFAHLLFSNGYVEQSISLEKQLNIIQVADLVLPDKETSFEEYTTMELLSVAMLIVISTFSIFVFLLTGIMIFSQVLFIIYAMFLPVSFILSMIPSFDGMSKRAITKLFNTILTRAGITLIITTAFSISTMLYTLSAGYPFFLIAFLQIVTFAGIYFKLGDLMSMFSLQSNDSQSVGSRVMRKPRMLMHAHMHRLQRKLGRSMTTLGAGSAIVTGKKGQSGSGSSARTQADHSRPDGKEKSTLGKRIGQTIGTVADTKDRMVDTASGLKEQVKDLPTNARYAVYQGKSKVKENVRDLTSSISQTKADRASGRKEQQEQRRKTIAKRRSEMEQVKQKKQPASSVHERPTTRQEQYHDEQTSKQSNIQTSYKESQQAKQERPAVKSDFSSPKVERQGNTVQEKTVQKPATSTTTADRTSQRPITKERPSTVQRVPLQNTRSRPPIKTATIKKVGKKP